MAEGLTSVGRAWLLPALLLCCVGCARYSLDQWPAHTMTLDHPDYGRYRVSGHRTMSSTGFRLFSIPLSEPESPSSMLANTGAEAFTNVEVTHTDKAKKRVARNVR